MTSATTKMDFKTSKMDFSMDSYIRNIINNTIIKNIINNK